MAKKEHPRHGKRNGMLRDRVFAYMDEHPNASNSEIALALDLLPDQVGKIAATYMRAKTTDGRIRRLELRVKTLEATLEKIMIAKGLGEQFKVSPTRFVESVKA